MSVSQPTYDFPPEGLGDNLDPSSLRESFHQSSLVNPVRIDIGNEDLRAQINALQYELDSLHQEREVNLLRHQQDLRDAETRAEADFKRAKAAEAQASFATHKHSAIVTEMQEALTKAENERNTLERKTRSLTEEANQLREEITESQEAVGAAERELTHKLSDVETRAATSQQAFNQLSQELETKSASLRESQQKLVEQETEVERLQKELSQLKDDGGMGSQEVQVIKREFSEQVQLVRTLEIKTREQQAELKRLRERDISINVLQEEKRDLSKKVQMMDSLRLSLTQAQLRQEVLEDERRSWTAYLEKHQDTTEEDGGLRFESPEEMARAFMKLQIQNVSLLDKVGVLKPEISTRDDKIRELEEKSEKVEAELEDLKTKFVASNISSSPLDPAAERKLCVRLERQKNLAIKEVEYLRAQLQSMDMEQSELEPEQHDAQKTEAIRVLQLLVDEFRSEAEESKKHIAALESQMKSGTEVKPEVKNMDIGQKRKRISSGLDDYDKMVELREQNREHLETISNLEQMKREMEAELEAHMSQLTALRESSRTRTLQLRDNPTAQAEGIKMNTLRVLRDENRALLAQLEKLIEAGKDGYKNGAGSDSRSSRSLIPLESLDVLRDEIDQMRVEVASKEKRNTRRMQVFSAKAAEFREAVASILGWKMDFMPNGRVKVTSMFYPGDEEQERSIVFDGENGTMKVSGGPKSEFAGEIRSLIEFWVEGKKEIPCFLAAMTLEFHERFTRTS